jgi:hypothetical protein
MPGSREDPVPLSPGEHFFVRDARGDVWGLTVNESGGLEAWLPSGMTTLVHQRAGNVTELHPWPHFMPVRPLAREEDR